MHDRLATREPDAMAKDKGQSQMFKFFTLCPNQDLQDERIIRMKAPHANPGNSEILRILLQKKKQSGV